MATEKNYQELLEYTGIGNIRRQPSPVKFKKFLETGAELLFPVTKELRAGTQQPFRLRCPGAKKVALVTTKGWQFFEKTGDMFEGSPTVGDGKNTVFAAYENEKNFEGLLEYTGK